MFKINYWTNSRFNDDDWDKYYCKSLTSTKGQLKKIIADRKERGINDNEKDIIKQFDIRVFNKRTYCNVWRCEIETDNELYITIEEINLI